MIRPLLLSYALWAVILLAVPFLARKLSGMPTDEVTWAWMLAGFEIVGIIVTLILAVLDILA